MQFLFKRNPVLRTHFKCYRYQTPTTQDTCHKTQATTNHIQTSLRFLGLVRYYRKFIKGFAKIAKPLTLLTGQQVQFEWTSIHYTTFIHLKEAIVQAPILHYLDPNKNTLFTLMPQMMHVEHNFHRNMMEWSFL